MSANDLQNEMRSDYQWLTINEAARKLKLSVRTLRNYMSGRKIPFYKNPQTGTTRIRADELDSWMMSGANHGR